MEPANPREWWKVYRKLWRREQDVKEAQEEHVQLVLSRARNEKQSPKAVYAGKVLQEPIHASAFIDGQPNPLANSSGQIRIPALKNARTGSYLAAMRKEVATARKGRGLGTVRQTHISKAPASMVAEHARRIASDCAKRTVAQPPLPSSRPLPQSSNATLANRRPSTRPALERHVRVTTGTGKSPSSRPTASNTQTHSLPRARDNTASDLEAAWALHPGIKKAAENLPPNPGASSQRPKKKAEGMRFQDNSKRQKV